MKKLLSLTLAVAMMLAGAFVFTACGSSDDNSQDLEYVQEKGTLVVGITDFEPMDYKDDSGNWVGFDADMATAFAESLGVDVEFVEIDWDSKIMELENKSIDCVWNGMTLTDEVKEGMEASNAYCKNAQVVVVNKDVADKYTSVEACEDLSFAVEAGSAGAEAAEENDFEVVEVQTQAAALMEVAAGTADACIIDKLMAGAMIGEGTAYPDLVNVLDLNEEEYGVGFRKGSNLAEALNDFFVESYADGTLMNIATKYGVQLAILEQK